MFKVTNDLITIMFMVHKNTRTVCTWLKPYSVLIRSYQPHVNVSAEITLHRISTAATEQSLTAVVHHPQSAAGLNSSPISVYILTLGVMNLDVLFFCHVDDTPVLLL